MNNNILLIIPGYYKPIKQEIWFNKRCFNYISAGYIVQIYIELVVDD